MTLNQRFTKNVANLQIASTIKISPGALFCTGLHSVKQKSIGLNFCKYRSESDLTYRGRHNSSRFTFHTLVHSWRFSVFITTNYAEYISTKDINIFA